MRRQQITNLLEEFKTYVGLSEYKIILKEGYYDFGENFAECDSDVYEKNITVKLGNKFNIPKSKDKEKGIDDNNRYNILLHEILHARLGIFQDQSQKLTNELEEEFINDLTRGLEKMLKQ